MHWLNYRRPHHGHLVACSLLLATLLLHAGCTPMQGGGANSGVRVRGVQLSDAAIVVPSDEPVALAAAKNEWVNFVVQVSGLPPRTARSRVALRLQPLNLATANAQIGPENFTAYQIVNMPVDTNRAGYVRHTGRNAINQSLPRALLPLKADSAGVFDLLPAMAREATTTPPHASTGNDLMLWVDVHVPPGARAGSYQMKCDVIEPEGTAGAGRVLATVPVQANVSDFVLPDERHLMMVGAVEWPDLLKHYAEQFEAVTPRLMARGDPRYAAAIRTLDQLVQLAQQHRLQVVIPNLQPTVKWPAGHPPQVTWDDYDRIVAPWLKGDAFADKTPLGYWPLPSAEKLSNYDLKSQREYWANAASHFDQADWLTRSSVVLHSTAEGGRADSAEALRLSGEAAVLLELNPRLRVEVPLEDAQVQFASPNNPNLVQPGSAARLITANPGIVFTSPVANWPNDVARPARWLRTDLTGLIPYVGAGGDERDARLWAWLASVPLPPPAFGVQYGPVRYIRWPGTLPHAAKPNEPADPSELIWFYPGSWFGLDEPVPTVQLKWLRRAQQDFEYLYLARQRGEAINSLVIARLMSKPVEIAPNQTPDPTFSLMSGTADPDAWAGALDLLTRYILMREPGQPVDDAKLRALNLNLGQWAEPQERPVVMGRTVRWLAQAPQQWPGSIDVRVGVDIYNAADRTPDQNLLEWTQGPSGWHYRPQPKKIDQLATYRVQRFDVDSWVVPAEIRNTDRTPVEIQFTDGFTKKKSAIRMVLPVAYCDRREGGLKFDGSLEDWSPDDLIVDGPLVRMFNRPALQRQELQPASTPSSVYTAWADENLYVAFKVTGVDSREMKRYRNFVDYQFRRAWGEDLVELVVQPVFGDNTLGPLLHVVCKPTSYWIERKMADPRQFVNPWQPIEGAAIRYAAIPPVDSADWRGEVAIPWQAITGDPNKGRPIMLRFNFTQHKTLTGESASWAGPIDYGRDENFTGLLILREPNTPGMGG